ncbi:hypothetical protein [Asaia sp. HN010]|uniref:hypothetical protein n=1 Tax=Asaia sp. HN010 TaxID=3081233 RepID=UPI003017BF2C
MVSTPKAPDPVQTASAQAQYNQDTATTQQLLNMTNQVTPYGNLTYSQTGNSTFTGADGKQYTVPQFTQTTTLNPQQQSTLNDTQAAAGNIAGTALSLSGSGLSSLGQPIDTSGAPALQSSFGGDVSQAYNSAKQAVLDQYMPTLDRNAEQSRSNMIASGLRPGSAAYSANEQTIGDNYTRAADQATQTAQSVQNQLFNQQQQQASFNNDARSQWLSQYYQQRDQPLNELSALLSQSQVNNATTGASSTPQTSVDGVNYSGLVQSNYQNQLQQSQGLMSGLFGLAGSASFLGGSYLGRK